MQKSEKIIGCILGGAIGDCLGGPYEGRTPPFTVDHRHKWRLSDDTLMTLATCEAISKQGRVDLGDHLKSGHLWSGQNRPFKSWPGLGCFYAPDSILSIQY